LLFPRLVDFKRKLRYSRRQKQGRAFNNASSCEFESFQLISTFRIWHDTRIRPSRKVCQSSRSGTESSKLHELNSQSTGDVMTSRSVWWQWAAANSTFPKNASFVVPTPAAENKEQKRLPDISSNLQFENTCSTIVKVEVFRLSAISGNDSWVQRKPLNRTNRNGRNDTIAFVTRIGTLSLPNLWLTKRHFSQVRGGLQHVDNRHKSTRGRRRQSQWIGVR
jgi:hypothetical protein